MRFSYLVSLLFLTGLAAVILWSWRPAALRRHLRGSLYFALVLTPFLGASESFALKWQAWRYGSSKTLGIHFLGSQAETYLFTFLVALTTYWLTAALIERGKS